MVAVFRLFDYDGGANHHAGVPNSAKIWLTRWGCHGG
jgi:hypothetical protein